MRVMSYIEKEPPRTHLWARHLSSAPYLIQTLCTYLVQCEEGFILQGLQVDLEQTGQVLNKNIQTKVSDEN